MSSFDHRLLGGSDPDSRVVELLVGLVGAVGVADLNIRASMHVIRFVILLHFNVHLPGLVGSPHSSCRIPSVRPSTPIGCPCQRSSSPRRFEPDKEK